MCFGSAPKHAQPRLSAERVAENVRRATRRRHSFAGWLWAQACDWRLHARQMATDPGWYLRPAEHAPGCPWAALMRRAGL